MSPFDDRQFRASILALLLMYAILGNLANLFGNGILPAFDMSFIGWQPAADTSRYTLAFDSINGVAFDQPLYFEEAGEWIDKARGSDAQRLINRLGIALYEGDSVKIGEARAALEKRYFGALQAAEYDIILHVVNPVERWHQDVTFSEQLMGHYEFQALLALQTTGMVAVQSAE